jgi:hypothetical protein
VLGKKSGIDSIRIKCAELGLEVPAEQHAELLARVKQLGAEKRGLVTDEEFRQLAENARNRLATGIGSIDGLRGSGFVAVPTKGDHMTSPKRVWLAAFVLVLAGVLGGAALAAKGGHKAGPQESLAFANVLEDGTLQVNASSDNLTDANIVKGKDATTGESPRRRLLLHRPAVPAEQRDRRGRQLVRQQRHDRVRRDRQCDSA